MLSAGGSDTADAIGSEDGTGSAELTAELGLSETAGCDETVLLTDEELFGDFLQPTVSNAAQSNKAVALIFVLIFLPP